MGAHSDPKGNWGQKIYGQVGLGYPATSGRLSDGPRRTMTSFLSKRKSTHDLGPRAFFSRLRSIRDELEIKVCSRHMVTKQHRQRRESKDITKPRCNTPWTSHVPVARFGIRNSHTGNAREGRHRFSKTTRQRGPVRNDQARGRQGRRQAGQWHGVSVRRQVGSGFWSSI